MPDYPPEIVQAAAEVMLRQYESQYSAGHLTWRDFATPAREVLDAAAPLFAGAVAARIRAFADQNDHVPSARRRAFRVAARVAAGAFTTEAESKQMAAQALAAGQYVACPLPEDGVPHDA